MVLEPRKTKFRKAYKGRIHGETQRGFLLNFGPFGLKAMGPSRLTVRQIEAARRAIVHYTKRSGFLWIRVFPDISVSRKPAEVRMGGGKGHHEFWACRVHPGRIIFELDGVLVDVAREAFRRAASKLPMRVTFVSRAGASTR